MRALKRSPDREGGEITILLRSLTLPASFQLPLSDLQTTIPNLQPSTSNGTGDSECYTQHGYPQTARLPAGRYNIRVVAPNGQVERRRVYVVAGRELNFNLKF